MGSVKYIPLIISFFGQPDHEPFFGEKAGEENDSSVPRRFDQASRTHDEVREFRRIGRVRRKGG